MKTASLVLEGGATRGVFTSGALDYMMEQDLYLSHVVGVSAGSCNAVDYVSKQIGRTRDCMIHKEKEYDYYYDFGKFIKEKSLLNMEMIFETYPKEIFPFDFDTYFASEIKCEIVTTNCLTGKPEYMTESSDRDRLMKMCRASSSMPLASPVVNIDDVPYLDGGLSDSIPIRRTVQYGNKKIVLILTRNQGYRKKPISKGGAKLYRSAYPKYPNLVKSIIYRPMIYNRTMDLIERLESEGNIFVLRPQSKTVGRLERNYDTLMSFYQHGYDQMEKEFGRLMEYLEK